jgi:pyrrolidone-carboxylate peptidase
MNRPAIIYFTGTIAESIAKQITIPYISYPIESSKTAIEAVVKQLKDTKPTIIIGLGAYSGRDQDKLRIERACNLKWRNTALTQFPITTIKTVLHETNITKFSYHHGNSWCNLLSVSCINRKELCNVYNFVHIPSTFHVELAAKEINRQLVSLSKTCA